MRGVNLSARSIARRGTRGTRKRALHTPAPINNLCIVLWFAFVIWMLTQMSWT